MCLTAAAAGGDQERINSNAAGSNVSVDQDAAAPAATFEPVSPRSPAARKSEGTAALEEAAAAAADRAMANLALPKGASPGKVRACL